MKINETQNDAKLDKTRQNKTKQNKKLKQHNIIIGKIKSRCIKQHKMHKIKYSYAIQQHERPHKYNV